MFTTKLNAQLGPCASGYPGTVIGITKHPVVTRRLLQLHRTNFHHMIVGMRRCTRRVVRCIYTGRNFKLSVTFSSRHKRLLSANNNVHGTLPLFSTSDPMLVRGMSVFSGTSLTTLCTTRLGISTSTSLLIDRHDASHCLVFSERSGLVT